MHQGYGDLSLYLPIQPPRVKHTNDVNMDADHLSQCIFVVYLITRKSPLQVKEGTRYSQFIRPPFRVLRYLIMDVNQKCVG